MGKKLVLAAGGSGGHLFPALALADELRQRGHSIYLATDSRGNKYNIDFSECQIFQIPSATITTKAPLPLINTISKLGRGIFKANKVLNQISASAVIGFGGYPSFPTVVAALLRGVPTVIHEQNAVLGRANRMLSKHVNMIATSFEKVKFINADLSDKVYVTGNPVRQIVIDSANRIYRAPLVGDTINVPVFGGSQGARFLSEVVPPALSSLPRQTRKRLIVTQQCRSEDLYDVKRTYRKADIFSNCAPFFSDLPHKMALAHLVICRSGASTIAELSVIGCPSILVPLPNAVDNDQLENAKTLTQAGAAWCIEQNELNVEELINTLKTILELPLKLENAAAAARRMGCSDSVNKLADLIENLTGR